MSIKYYILICCLLPVKLLAQNAPTIIPQNATKKDTARQTDLIDVAKGLFSIKKKNTVDTSSREKKVFFSFLPFGTTVPGGSGRALITSTTAGMYLGPRSNTSLSTAVFAPYWNLKSRFGLPLRTSIWLPGNKWTIQGDTRFLVYPQYTWGLGSRNEEDNKTLVDYKYIRFYQSALKRIKPYLFAGLGYNLDYRINVKSDNPDVSLKDFTGYSYGTDRNSFSSGLSLNLLYDTRNNTVNPLPGSYANIIYRVNPTFLGSNNNWQSLYLDVRKYVSLNPARPNQQNTLAFWSYFWTTLSEGTPYLDLPSTGWDPNNRSARGIDQNRYRGKSLLYFESEYRRDITNNGLLGFVLFANVNTVSGSGSLLRSWHPAAGTGLRIKFNKATGTNIGIDYGFSKGYSAILLNLGEAF
ncbi:BamA/TamA family outer membrane protein [Mucilaginibacter sp. UR6-1]|uniref:BamA/TamA family outer membrane protein n=1 Tax=Mucilaginibacter sp. UR6-1 TaxID=1435643 RepID=UPI001E46AA6C|nr:BamA/TamA family outer membrane protein [Mucilaginibacter sp. UR6-1]MCC8411248.1 BamA/TamA family outer membrane protein [Mucilaginibacter sp. UR6-1]